MASLTSWFRLEPLPRTSDLGPALEARVADPLWLLARQWQTLEFRGEDAGSPIVATIGAHSGGIDLVAYDAAGALPFDHAKAPLETSIESESFDLLGLERWRVEAGLHFLRLLVKHRAPAMRARYTEHYGFVPGDDPAGSRAMGFRQIARGRAPDGARLFADLAAHRGPAAILEGIPSTPRVPDDLRASVVAAANEWLAWCEGLLTKPGNGTAWDPSQMEYSFAVAADSADGRVVLAADEYADAHLDWHAFRRRPDATLPGEVPDASTRQIVRTVVPTPASYSGMPGDRFWQFEDGNVSFGSLDAGPSDLTRLALVEFALVYGNDWFVVPVDLNVGSLCTITALEVVDTFGFVTRIGQVPPGDGWAMFELTDAARSPEHPSPYFLPPTLANTVDGDPIESVLLLRDEMANMVWGVEQIVLAPTGDRIDRREQVQAAGLGLQQIDGDIADAELIYRLATPVPDHWIPFVPVPANNGAPGDAGVILERRTMRRMSPTGFVDVEPLGVLLEPGRVLRINEEAVPREGILLERSFQLARWIDGSTHLWLGRRKRVGRGEGRSGLRFDAVDQIDLSDV